MGIFLRRGHPVEKVHKEMRRLAAALNAVPPQHRAVGGQRGLPLCPGQIVQAGVVMVAVAFDVR